MTDVGDSDDRSCSGMSQDFPVMNDSSKADNISDGSIAGDLQNLDSSYSQDAEIYYGVYIPQESENSSLHNGDAYVFTNKTEVIKLLKLIKTARFKAFMSHKEAILFSLYGPEKSSEQGFCESPVIPKEFVYKGLKAQDYVSFRKAIEKNDLLLVRKFVEENPKYLIGSGDTPSILQEGSRYNALHVAARGYSASISSYILCMISNLNFLKKLYGPVSQSLIQRKNILVDLYLNTPDKGGNETPLHFASKLGAVEVVKVLSSYSVCDKNIKNKHGLTAIEVACTRAPEAFWKFKSEIISLLDSNQYYVPVLRSDDNCSPPSVGEPFCIHKPPKSNPGMLSSPVEIKAVAGPMTEQDARLFRKKWKTPPRKAANLGTVRPELADPFKGLEVVGRNLAHEEHVTWKEYWPFLDCFVDMSSPEGLNCLENYLKNELIKFAFNKVPAKNEPMSQMEALINQMQNLHLDSPPTDAVNRKSKSPSSTVNQIDVYGMESFDLAIRRDCPSFYAAYQHVTEKSPKAKRTVITETMEKSCQIFATRIGFVLVKGLKNSILSEIACFQVYLSGCAADVRFHETDFHKAHYRLSVLINEKILSISNDKLGLTDTLFETMSAACDFVIGDRKLTSEDLVEAATCICQCTTALLTNTSPSEDIETNDNVPADVLWAVAKSCKCSLQVSRGQHSRPSASRALFRDDEGLSDDMDSEGSSDNEEFHTAPSSPLHFPPSLKSSLPSSEEEMLLSETGPEIFLSGDKPTKLDKAVLEAIKNISVPLKTYPHIVLWKKSCEEYARKSPSESWSTPMPVKRGPQETLSHNQVEGNLN